VFSCFFCEFEYCSGLSRSILFFEFADCIEFGLMGTNFCDYFQLMAKTDTIAATHNLFYCCQFLSTCVPIPMESLVLF